MNRGVPGPKPCHHFQRGTCRFGARCKYSHDTPTFPEAQSRPPTRRNGHGEQQALPQDRLREWQKLLSQNPSSPWAARMSTIRNRETSDRFFQLALELMEGDIGASQETVRLMAKEDGLAFIKNLIDRQTLEAVEDSAKAHLWLNQIRPIFEILTHPRVVDSNVLEQYVAIICNFIQGIGGRRMRTLFDFIGDLLDVWRTLPMAEKDEYGISACDLSLSVLATMIDCNTGNIIDENYHEIVSRFEHLVEDAHDSVNEFSKRQARKYLQYLWRRLGVGDALAETKTAQKAPVTRAEFVMQKDLPGLLSADGPRHDNDHENICDIRILPTYEEVVSKRNEYLPTTDPSQFHKVGILGRLDREFRLLREDTVGQLRDAVSIQLSAMRDPSGRPDRGNRSTVRTYAYEDATVINISFDRHSGMDLVIRFRQPASKKTVQQRRDWWGNSRRLQHGGLVCIISQDGSVLFCVVAESTIVAHNKSREKGKEQEPHEMPSPAETLEKLSLADDDESAHVHLHLAETRRKDVTQVLEWFQNLGPTQQRYLVEFPGVLLPSFQHTLTALQRMSQKLSVPFDDLLAPVRQASGSEVQEVGPPQYTTRAGFTFDLSCLTDDGRHLAHSPQTPLDPAELSNCSTLDPTQSAALLNALSRRLALIQGPPGTGKSYTGEKVIQALLANSYRAQLGPILCVCYTNHALDQLLLHLLRQKVNIIRIGSRSKAEELEHVNLRVVAQNVDRTKTERHGIWSARESLKNQSASLSKLIAELESCQSLNSLVCYLRELYPRHHNALFGKQGEGGFEKVDRRTPRQRLSRWQHGGQRVNSPPRSIHVLRGADIWGMTHSERSSLLVAWMKDIRDDLIVDIVREHDDYQAKNVALRKLFHDVDLRGLHDAQVIGVTTTGLARNLDLLQKLRCKVMLCEEAGEVLEAHTLTALLPSVEHAILIGDHLQLRPQIANYDLQSTSHGGARYSLDVSLFERLLNPLHPGEPKLPYDTLETQRRMHPSVSQLIRSTLYPSLDDGGAVATYPEVCGMKRRLFWLRHESREDQETQLDPITTSRTNTFEVDLTVSLVQHLVRQGSYGPDDIAVVTPYLAQLMRLRREMGRLFAISVGERDLSEIEALEADVSAGGLEALPQKKAPTKTTLLKSIRLATVDNFQGEEAKVVVISLVRSNDANKCGFLSTPNRINVLLSRAQHGMYLIGNANTYRHVPMWAKVLEILERNGNVGEELELQCPRHPNTPLLVSKADDFLRVAPEGGCILPCDRRLSCGHACVNRCHHENIHNAVRCLEPCPRPKKGCEHPCKLVCGDSCKPRCDEYLRGLNIILACGHKISSAFCWQAQDPSSITCKETVKKTVPGCNHTVEVFCYTDVNCDLYKCRKICGDPLPCGHNCRSSCDQCRVKKDSKIIEVNHGICKQDCGRKYTSCPHSCTQPCHPGVPCRLCPAPCEVHCSHSRCGKKCHEPCTPCAEQACASSCPHARCTMPCAAPCDWIPCSKRCEKVLECGHRCPSLCGEICPSAKYCQTCCSDDIKAVQVDFIMMSQYHEIDLDEDPCIFPDCGHFTTKTNMDGIMDMRAHYEMSAEGNPTALKKATEPFSMDEVKKCPNCRCSLRNIARYGRIVRRAMLDEATKKFISWSNTECYSLANKLLDVQDSIAKATKPGATPRNSRPQKLILATGRLKELYKIHDWVGTDRYAEALKLWRSLSDFTNQVKKDEQPFQRVDDFVQHAARQRKLEGDFEFDETRIQNKAYLQACILLLKCDIVIVSDFMLLLKDPLGGRPKLFPDFAQQLADGKTLAAQAKATGHPRQEAEAHVYVAQFCIFSRILTLAKPSWLMPLSEEEQQQDEQHKAKANALKAQAVEHLDAASDLATRYPGQTEGLLSEIQDTHVMLNDGVFYNAVTADEMRDVYSAMAREFSGTGHWYRCENGHPFTVGECGMPMQTARCPECGAPVGGQSHNPAAGVEHAEDIDRLANQMGRMGMDD
ncbi:hypothetical protein GGR52DRAFT_550456 [Hypoxylon sp. FL1284]|nr:hypothetical protein GGR52DRAFT_550456 [Hypoxylon sp. FL1284]